VPILFITEIDLYRYMLTATVRRSEKMAAIIDLKAEFGKLTMLKQRSPTTTAAEKSGAFARVAPYRDGAIYLSKFAGSSDWERHPRGEEIVQIVDGATAMHLLTSEGRQTIVLTAGMVALVPQGTWHRFEAPDGVCLVTVTPQPTDQVRIDVEDPRAVRPFKPTADLPPRRDE
jgi:mannose-6-phosphate isomerase-like protein (cupin superfamily)